MSHFTYWMLYALIAIPFLLVSIAGKEGASIALWITIVISIYFVCSYISLIICFHFLIKMNDEI